MSNIKLVSWWFKPSQPQKIISGLRETFIKKYIVERTNKAEIRPEEQCEEAKSCRENLLNEIISSHTHGHTTSQHRYKAMFTAVA